MDNSAQPQKKKEIQHDNTYQGERVTMDTANPAEILGRSMLIKTAVPSQTNKKTDCKSDIVSIQKLINERFPESKIEVTEKNANLVYIMATAKKDDKYKFYQEIFEKIMNAVNDGNIDLAEKLCADKDFDIIAIKHILNLVNEANKHLIERLCADKEFPVDKIFAAASLIGNYKEDADIVEDMYDFMLKDKGFTKEEIGEVIWSTGEYNIEQKKNIYNLLKDDENISRKQLASIMQWTEDRDYEFKKNIYELLKKDESFPKDKIANTVRFTNEYSNSLALKMLNDEKFPKDKIPDVISGEMGNMKYIEKIYDYLREDEDFPMQNLPSILKQINSDNINITVKLCSDPNFPKNEISKIVKFVDKNNMDFAEKLCSDTDFPKNSISSILENRKDNTDDFAVMNEMYDYIKNECPEFPKEAIANVLHTVKMDNLKLAVKLCKDNYINPKTIHSILRHTINNSEEAKLEVYEALKEEKAFPKTHIPEILKYITDENKKLITKICKNSDIPQSHIFSIASNTQYGADFAEKLYSNPDLKNEYISFILNNLSYENYDLAQRLCLDKKLNFPQDYIGAVLIACKNCSNKVKPFLEKLCFDKELEIPKSNISYIIERTTDDNLLLAEKLCYDKDFPKELITPILNSVAYEFTDILEKKVNFAEKLCFDKEINYPKEYIAETLSSIPSNEQVLNFAEELCKDKIIDPKDIQKILDGSFGDRIDGQIVIYELLKNKQNFPKDRIADIVSSTTDPNIVINLDNSGQLGSSVEKIEHQRQLALNEPNLYINGDDYENEDEMRNDIQSFFAEHYTPLLDFSNYADKEVLNNLLRMRLEDAEEYLYKFTKLSDEEKELYRNFANSCNIDGKPFLPTQKIEFLDLIEGYNSNGLSTDKIKEMISSGKVDIGKLNIDLLNQIMKNIGFTDEEISSIPKEKLFAWDKKHIHLLAKGIANAENDDDGQLEGFKDIIRAANLNDFENYINDESNIYGQSNAKTKALFKQMGIDYYKWVHPSASHELQFVSMDKQQNQLAHVVSQLEENMNILMQTPIKGHIKKQFPKYIQDDSFVLHTEKSISKKQLLDLLEILTDESDSGQMAAVWKRAKGNLNHPDPNRAQTAQNTLTILSHLKTAKDYVLGIEDAIKENGKKAKPEKKIDWTIKMWDRIPQKDLFQGNYSTCCIGMGGGNESAMPHYIMNTAYNMIEFVNSKTGDTTGNALCYFIKDSNGKPAFVIDNVEIKNSLIPSVETQVKLRTALTEYASSIVKDVTGKDDIPIYLGSNFNDVKYEDLPFEFKDVSMLGETDNDTMYMDLFNGWINKNETTGEYTKKCKLLKLK